MTNMSNSKIFFSKKAIDASIVSTKSDFIESISLEQLALGQNINAHTNAHNYAHAMQGSNAKWTHKLLALPAYYWVLIAQVVIILPHAAHLPLWLMGFAVVSIIAQLPRVKARFKKLAHLKRVYQSMQMLGFLLGLTGLWLTYNSAFGLDMGVAFLVLCLISKLWEMYKRRDAYVVLNLSLFVLAALFLMDQGLVTTLEVIVGAVIVLLAFIALNDDGNARGDGRLRTLGVLGLGALPLLVVLFLFFPRLPPLWSVQLSGQQATTGVSDSMSPGDFANLGQSTELAFRVEFADNRPPQQQLYWRGLVFSDFDGVTWRPSPQQRQWQPAPAETGKKAKPLSTNKVLLAWVSQLGSPFISRQTIKITNIVSRPTILAAFSIPAHWQTITADSRTTTTSISVNINAIHKGMFEEEEGFISNFGQIKYNERRYKW